MLYVYICFLFKMAAGYNITANMCSKISRKRPNSLFSLNDFCVFNVYFIVWMDVVCMLFSGFTFIFIRSLVTAKKCN